MGSLNKLICVNLTIDSLPFTAVSRATAVLPRGAKMRFDWLTEYNPPKGIISGNRIVQKEVFDRSIERLLKGLFL